MPCSSMRSCMLRLRPLAPLPPSRQPIWYTVMSYFCFQSGSLVISSTALSDPIPPPNTAIFCIPPPYGRSAEHVEHQKYCATIALSTGETQSPVSHIATDGRGRLHSQADHGWRGVNVGDPAIAATVLQLRAVLPGEYGAIAVEFIETGAQVSAVMLVAQNLSKLV